VIEATSNSIPVLPILIATLESTEVATPAQPVVADNGVLADPTIVDQTPEPSDTTTPAATAPATSAPATSAPKTTTPAVTVPFEPVSIVNWATAGTYPVGIATDNDDNIYTTNNGSNNVSKITPSGTSTILGSTGAAPYGITIDNAGNIYTGNFTSNNVTKIAPNGTSTILGTTDQNPVGIAIDTAGNIYTTHTSMNNVSKITTR
jgi:hypothetical protein